MGDIMWDILVVYSGHQGYQGDGIGCVNGGISNQLQPHICTTQQQMPHMVRYMEVSINRGIPKWLVYNRNSLI